MLDIENHLNLIRKIAWSYVRTHPGLEFDDLFSEACLACLEARDKFNPERGKESTFIWRVVNNHLLDVIGRETARNTQEELVSEIPERNISFEAAKINDPLQHLITKEEWEELLTSLSPEALSICEILSNPIDLYLPTDKPKLCKGKIIKMMRISGWSWTNIWRGFREIKQVLASA